MAANLLKRLLSLSDGSNGTRGMQAGVAWAAPGGRVGQSYHEMTARSDLFIFGLDFSVAPTVTETD
jgi:hypothetical protein